MTIRTVDEILVQRLGMKLAILVFCDEFMYQLEQYIDWPDDG